MNNQEREEMQKVPFPKFPTRTRVYDSKDSMLIGETQTQIDIDIERYHSMPEGSAKRIRYCQLLSNNVEL